MLVVEEETMNFDVLFRASGFLAVSYVDERRYLTATRGMLISLRARK